MNHCGTRLLRTERLLLRPFTMNDAEAMFKNWASDPEVTKFLTWPTHQDVETSRRVLGSWIPYYAEKDYYQWAVVPRENGDEPIGSIAAVRVMEDISAVHVGYCIGRSWWHRGITTEALKAVIDYFFAEVGAGRVEARHDPGNPYSGMVMKKAGMQYEGTLRSADRNNQGICDACYYGILREEWQAQKDSEKEEAMNRHITILDGAQGTLLWQKAAERGIPKASVWTYNLTHPELVAEVCRAYAEAGSEIICSNTFGANRLTVEKESDWSVREVVTAAIRTAKEALEGTGARVALDIGPLSVLTEPYGDLSEEEAEEIFAEMVQAGTEAGADCIFLETFMQTGMLLAAVRAAKRSDLPVFCSMSFEANGRTIFGASVEEMIEELEPLGVAAVGMNCSLGPDLAVPVIREFAEKTDLPLFFKPNAGMPVIEADGTATYNCTPEEFSAQAALALQTGRIAYLGGCCGTDPEFIKELKKLVF